MLRKQPGLSSVNPEVTLIHVTWLSACLLPPCITAHGGVEQEKNRWGETVGITIPEAVPEPWRCGTERRDQWGGLGLSLGVLELFSNLNDSMNMVGFWVGQQLVCCLLPGLTVQIASGFLLGLQKSPTICLVTLETAQESQFPCITSLVAESCDPGANSHLCDAQAE